MEFFQPTKVIILVLVLFFFSSCATWKLGKSGQQKIQGKTFVIIGASSGFGRGIAEELGGYKANVIIAARRGDVLDEVATKIRAAGGTAQVVTTDISNPEDVAKLAQIAVEKLGHIDVWMNVAGIGAIGRFWEIPIAEQAKIVDINLKGFIYGSHFAINIFKKQGYGTLINFGSIESHNPLAYHASYAATKGGVLNLGQALNQELRLSGHKKIKVVTIEPWAVDTPFWRHAANYSGGKPSMAAMDGPEKVINATLRASLRPRKELAVGWKAKASKFSHQLIPHTTERLSANIAHRYQIKKAPPADSTSGAVFKAMPQGTGVDDGVRKRMKEEKKILKGRAKRNTL